MLSAQFYGIHDFIQICLRFLCPICCSVAYFCDSILYLVCMRQPKTGTREGILQVASRENEEKNSLNLTFDLFPFTYFFLNASKRIRRWPVDARLWADFFISFSRLFCFRTSSWVSSITVCFACCWFGNWCWCCGSCCHSWCEFLRFIFHQFSTTFVAVKSKFFTWC